MHFGFEFCALKECIFISVLLLYLFLREKFLEGWYIIFNRDDYSSREILARQTYMLDGD